MRCNGVTRFASCPLAVSFPFYKPAMLSIDDALAAVLDNATALPVVALSLADALGQVLAENVASDIDSPPFDKAMVDGYAVVAADLAGGRATLDVIEDITAGMVPRLAVSTGKATRIMTGSPMPEGADAVVMIERVTDQAGGRVTLSDDRVAAGQNIQPRGKSLVRGQTVVPAGTLLRSIEIGALAEVGRAVVQAIRRPHVAVIATGDELVPHSQTPGAGQIRNSNSPMLVAAARESGATAIDLGIARDNADAIAAAIETGLASDIVLLSGGVSAGVLDLVPGVLKSLGVEELFHRVRVKPGKPLWFGRRRHDGRTSLVFGLPGNPVGSLVSFELFVRPAIAKLAGRGEATAARQTAVLVSQVASRGDRPTYYPAAYRQTPEGPRVEPLTWHGSADLATLVRANAFVVMPAGDRPYVPGETVEVHLLRT